MEFRSRLGALANGRRGGDSGGRRRERCEGARPMPGGFTWRKRLRPRSVSRASGFASIGFTSSGLIPADFASIGLTSSGSISAGFTSSGLQLDRFDFQGRDICRLCLQWLRLQRRRPLRRGFRGRHNPRWRRGVNLTGLASGRRRRRRGDIESKSLGDVALTPAGTVGSRRGLPRTGGDGVDARGSLDAVDATGLAGVNAKSGMAGGALGGDVGKRLRGVMVGGTVFGTAGLLST